MLITEARPLDRPGPRIVFVNDAVCQMTGYTADELVGCSPRIFQGPLTDREALRRIREALQEYRPITEELVNYRKDGSLYIIELQLMPMAGESGAYFSHFIGIQRDITLRRQAEMALRAGEERMRRLVENLPMGAVFCQGNELHANRASERITGYSRDQFQTLDDWFYLLYREEADHVRSMYEADRLAGFPEPRLVSLYNKKGEPRQVEFAAHGEGDNEVWIFRDVTDTERLERMLSQAGRAARVGGWEIHIHSRQVYWTEETYRIHEVEPGQFTPNLDEAIHYYTPECRPIIENAVSRAIDLGEPFDLELDFLTARGRQLRVRSVGLVEQAQGRTTRIYGSIQDITLIEQARQEREQFQVNLLQTQKLESLGLMAGGIAHDFNNILTGILGFAELARAQVPPQSPPAELLGKLLQAGNRASDLCKQMLAYAGKARFKIEPLNLNTLIEQAAPLLQVSISKRAMLTMCLQPELPPIEADASQFHQVLMNLVLNASEALEDRDGLITLQTSLVHCSTPLMDDVQPSLTWSPGTYVCLEVCDTGCGMDEDTRRRIFEPFFSTKFTGRGLGLASVLGILRGHKSLLKVDSKPGVGSRFRLYFPQTHRARSNQGILQEDDTWVGEGTVLVIDDEPTVRFITTEMVRSLGFSVLEACDGAEGLSRLQEHGAEVVAVLLDLTMPRLDGIETLSAIQVMPEPPSVILMSGYSKRELNELYGERGLAGFLQKPFSFSDLRRSLRHALKSPQLPLS
jgi:PAS domain S-box-containing protein